MLKNKLKYILLSIIGGTFILSYFIFQKNETIGSITFFDRNNKELFHLEQRPNSSTIDTIPYVLLASTLITEDQRFYTHQSIDYLAVLRSLAERFRSQTATGASTISQQTARRFLGINRKRTALNKLQDILIASFIESNYSKEQILQKYLSALDYGNQTLGPNQASQLYFDTALENIDWQKGSFLAAIPQNPQKFTSSSSNEALKNRQNFILSKLKQSQLITDEEIQTKSDTIQLSTSKNSIKAPHFVYFVLEELENSLGKNFWLNHNVKVVTTLDYDLYEAIRRKTIEELEQLKDKNIYNNASLVLDNQSGEILSYIGNPNFFDQAHNGEVDMVQALRQPGSALKPFIYLATILKGWGTGTVIYDIPSRFLTTDALPYTPLNYDLQFHGPVTLRQALANSYNIPAVKALGFIGISTAKNMFTQFGITTLTKPDDYYGLSLALGSGEVSLFQLTNAYRSLANEGTFSRTHFVKKLIIDAQEQDWKETKSNISSTETLKLATQMITNILSDEKAREAEFQTYNNLTLPFPVAAKTGTSRDFHDNWTIGFSTNYTVGVWTGNSNGAPMTQVSGISGAAPVFQQIFQLLPSGESFPLSQTIDKVRICLPSGLLPTALCTHTVEELFLIGTAPKSVDTWYQRNGLHLPTELSSWSQADPLLQTGIEIIKPQENDVYRLDPEIPDNTEKIPCTLIINGLSNISVKLNGQEIATSTNCQLPSTPNHYTLQVSGKSASGKTVDKYVHYQVISSH